MECIMYAILWFQSHGWDNHSDVSARVLIYFLQTKLSSMTWKDCVGSIYFI